MACIVLSDLAGSGSVLPGSVLLGHPRSNHRSDIAGVQFDFVTQSHVLESILQWRAARQQRYIVLANPHSVMTCRRNPRMHDAAKRAGLCLPDGVGVVLAAKLLGHGRRHRVTGPALLLQVCDQGRAHGLRHFFVGGGEGVAGKLRDRLLELYPGLQVVGVATPPFTAPTPGEDARLVRRINRAKPDVVWVALGAPKQEVWMSAHLNAVNASAMIGVGAAFDFHSGKVKWAPHWVRRWGLEWAHRLFTDPGRMWRRNIDSPRFLLAILAQAVRQKLALKPRGQHSLPGLPPEIEKSTSKFSERQPQWELESVL